ncbi:MAG: PspC domain-containing protein [Actinomadura rubrobrunea]|nr:PspC domain-containing protein [Actinomadura rubrobrunea]
MTDERTATDSATTAHGCPRLARDQERRVLTGVCSGLGRFMDVDPVVLRVVFAVLTLAGGKGLWLYVAALLLMPRSPEEDAPAERMLHRRFDAAGALSILGALLVVTAAFAPLGHWSSGDVIAVLTVVGLVLVVAHARGVDLGAALCALPQRLQGHPMEPAPPSGAGGTAPEKGGVSLQKDKVSSEQDRISFEKTRVSLQKDRVPSETAPERDAGLPDGMVDLAALASRRRAAEEMSEPDARADGSGRCTTAAAVPLWTSPVTAVTMPAALAAGAAVLPIARAHPAPDAALIVMSTALAVVGLGLLVGGWFPARGLAAVGTLLTFALLTTSVVAEAPRDLRYGDIEWRPVDGAHVEPAYKMGVGSARLDLSRTRFSPGQRVGVTVQVALGSLKVRVPRTARVELDARLSLGDLQVDGRTIAGPAARVTEVLEPEEAGREAPPVIALRVRGRIGDVEVTRA